MVLHSVAIIPVLGSPMPNRIREINLDGESHFPNVLPFKNGHDLPHVGGGGRETTL